MTIHDFDMARFLLGEEPVSALRLGLGAGRSGDRRTSAMSMCAVVLTSEARSRIAQISNPRRASYGYDQRIEVLGEQKGLVFGRQSCAPTNVEIANGDGLSPRAAP